MKKNEAIITLRDTTDKIREMKEFQEMLTEISEVADKYGFNLPKVDIGITVVLPGTIHNVDIDFKFL